jgi:hypothetical protein
VEIILGKWKRKEEDFLMGSKALFVEHPTDHSKKKFQKRIW